MPRKKDQDSSPGVKLLRIFRKLMLDGRRHFQTDLATEFQCSPQTIIRLISIIEEVVGISLKFGLENRRRWYQISTISRSRLGLDFEELRYLSICRDLVATSLPLQVRNRIDDTIFNLSVLMADQSYAKRDDLQKQQFSFFSKGKIDYTPHFEHLENLLRAVDERLICLVKYKPAGKTVVKEYRLTPAHIISMSGTLYVLGGELDSDFVKVTRMLNLALHRIHDVSLLERHFDGPLRDVEPGSFGLPWHEPRIFKIVFKPGKAADYVQERIWADEQKLEVRADGSLLLEITTRAEPEILAWIRSFGDEAKILTG